MTDAQKIEELERRIRELEQYAHKHPRYPMPPYEPWVHPICPHPNPWRSPHYPPPRPYYHY